MINDTKISMNSKTHNTPIYLEEQGYFAVFFRKFLTDGNSSDRFLSVDTEPFNFSLLTGVADP
jgi:hypothetical protein